MSDKADIQRPGDSATAKKGKQKHLLSLYFIYVVCGFAAVSLFLSFSAGDQLPGHESHSASTGRGFHHNSILAQSKVSLSALKKNRNNKRQQKKGAKLDEVTPPQKRNVKREPEFDGEEELQHQNQPPESEEQDETPESESSKPSPLAGLSCADHGGPLDSLAQEMVYWEDIPSDNRHVSPFYAPERYLTFEPDHGGFNNIRMAMETVVALAYAMGRTLVLPPAQSMYLLGKVQPGQSSTPKFSFAHFFDMPAIHAEHNGLDIITTDEFIKRQIDTSERSGSTVLQKLVAKKQRTNYDGDENTWYHILRGHARSLIWDPSQCFAYFPALAHHDTKRVKELYREVVTKTLQNAQDLHLGHEVWNQFIGKPPPLNASEAYRLGEFYNHRKHLCLYDSKLQDEPVLHFPAALGKSPVDRKMIQENNEKDKDDEEEAVDRSKWDPRLLVHFYAFLFFADYHQDLWMKRFVRDHVRYTDEIQCAAARVVAELRRQVRTVHGRSDGLFHSMHIRRGDFQFKETRISAEEMLVKTKLHFKDGDIVFVATDHHEKEFFKPLEDHYELYFLDDFIASSKGKSRNVTAVLGPEVNSNYYGMIDQLVASRGKIFYGCWFSTFTGYINRLRGYHSQKNKEPGYEDGKIMTSFYYALPDRLNHMLTYYPVKQAFYAREFPTAWRLIDQDLHPSAIQPGSISKSSL